MNSVTTIAVLSGTTRKQRKSINAAQYVADYGSKIEDVEIIFVDPTDFIFPGDGNDPESKDPRYSEITAKADAFFIVTPEYNHSFPSSLKRMLDSELANYKYKPVAMAGVSNGNWGGVRAIESLVLAVRQLGLIPLSSDVYFPWVQNIFNDDSEMNDEYRKRYEENLDKLFTELIWFAKTIKAAKLKKP